MASAFGTQHAAQPIASAVTYLDQPLSGGVTIGIGANFQSDRVRAEALPQANLWILQTAGAAGVTASAQWEAGPDIWHNFAPPFALPPGAPVLVNYVLGASNYRVNIDNTSGAAVTVRYRLSATIPG